VVPSGAVATPDGTCVRGATSSFTACCIQTPDAAPTRVDGQGTPGAYAKPEVRSTSVCDTHAFAEVNSASVHKARLAAGAHAHAEVNSEAGAHAPTSPTRDASTGWTVGATLASGTTNPPRARAASGAPPRTGASAAQTDGTASRNLPFAAAVGMRVGEPSRPQLLGRSRMRLTREEATAIRDLKFTYQPERCSFKTWLHGIARRKAAVQFCKRQGKGRVMEPLVTDNEASSLADEIPYPPSRALDEIWDREWEQTLLDAALERAKRKVSPGQFQIYHYYVMQGHDTAEMAKALGVSSGRVYFAKNRVGKKVREEIAHLRDKLV